MKHPELTYLLVSAVIMMTSCEHSTPQDAYVEFSKFDTTDIFQPTSVIVSDVYEEAPWARYTEEEDIGSAGRQEVSSRRRVTSTDVISVVRDIVDMCMYRKVVQVAGTYTSVDADYNPVTLSGKVFYPHDKPIRNVILVSHFTIGANFECPSETFALEGILASLGYLVIMPDYIGYGATRTMVHPYLQADLTSENVADMLFAVMPWIGRENLPLQSDSIILLGYSQGGATTMHVQRMLETSPVYRAMYPLKHTYCGSGPYDVALTYDYSIRQDLTGIPCAVPMIIQGMSEGMASPLHMSYFFKEPLLSNYDEWLNSKLYTVKQINLMIDATRLSEILTEDASDKTNPETQRLYKRLIENSINPIYAPVTPMYMFHSMEDRTVPFINSQRMQMQFDNYGCQNIEYDFGYYGTHTTGMMKFLLKCIKRLR